MGKSDQGLRKGNRYRAIVRVLVFIRNGSDVLLIKGASTKKIWADLYNGIGGHVEVNENILSAANRELFEESGLKVNDLDLKAVVNIDAGDPELGILMFAFTGWSADRETVASNEGELHWIPVDKLDEITMVEDLYWLLPRILVENDSGFPLFLHYGYDANDNLVIREYEAGSSS